MLTKEQRAHLECMIVDFCMTVANSKSEETIEFSQKLMTETLNNITLPDSNIEKQFKPFDGDCDTLYSNEKYDNGFLIESIGNEVYSVTLEWEQGRGNNYRFVTQTGFNIFPERVKLIEVL